jgi:glycosyltransferase involved in cell wall biosynthesis
MISIPKERQVLNVGIFHPALNFCGGAEWVAVNIINSLKKADHKITLLTNEKVNQEKIMRMLGQRVNIDSQIIFPLEIFSTTDIHNVYSDFIRSSLLKHNCAFLIDTYSNAILPGTDATYIHFPLSKRIPTRASTISRLKNLYYIPYTQYEKRAAKNPRRIIFANSKFTKAAIKETLGIEANLLYPPISRRFTENAPSVAEKHRKDTVVTISMICREKNLFIIPYIAKLTKNISFSIIGYCQSMEALNSLRALIKRLGVSERVQVTPNVPQKTLKQTLDSSKIYLHTSIGEHFGVSIVEAMARGCIPIVHDSGGPQETVPKHLRYASPEEAAEKIKNAIEVWSPSQAQKMMEIASNFSEEIFSKRFLETINLPAEI